MFTWRVDETVVDFVGKNRNLGSLSQNFSNGFEFSLVVDPSGWVVGRVENEYPGPVGNRFGQRGRIDGVVSMRVGLENDRGGSHELDLLWIAGPVGRDADHFVAWVAQAIEGVEQSVLGSVGNHHLLGVQIERLDLGRPGGDGFLEGDHSAGGGVFGKSALESLDGPVLDQDWSVEIGLSSPEIDDIDSFLTKFGGSTADG